MYMLSRCFFGIDSRCEFATGSELSQFGRCPWKDSCPKLRRRNTTHIFISERDGPYG